VTLEPSADPVPWTWASGRLAVTIPAVRIHEILVVE
jgi:hypothetical protein